MYLNFICIWDFVFEINPAHNTLVETTIHFMNPFCGSSRYYQIH